MTVYLLFINPKQQLVVLSEHVPTVQAALEAGMAYTHEPEFIGSTISTRPGGFTMGHLEHVAEILTQANAA